MTRAIVYDTETGEIVREMRGAVPLDNQRLADSEAMLVDGGEPEREDAFEGSIPESLDGKKVDVEAREVVDGPDYSETRTRDDIAADLEAGDITTEEALLELLRR